MIYFLLPAYNEEKGLPPVLEAISALTFPDEEWRVVVVDDGSTDSTPALLDAWAKRIPLTVLTHKPNLGLGRAMRTGLRHLAGIMSDEDAVVAMDSDNTHDPALSIRMRHKQRTDDLDVVIASRYCSEAENDRGEEVGLSVQRRVLSRGASNLLDFAFHVKGARDYTCGYRLYSGRIIRRASEIYGEGIIEEAGFVCMAELLVKLGHIGAGVGEVPLVLRYDLKAGASKLKVMRTISRYLRLIWRYKVLGDLGRFDAVPRGH